MVGPVTDADRDSFALRVKVAVVVLIGVSAGLIAVQGDASIAVVGIATGIGLVVGVVLVWIVFPGGDGPRQTGN